VCSQWDKFIWSINEVVLGSNVEALLENTSNCFSITIVSEKEVFKLCFKSEETNVGDGVVVFIFNSVNDEDILGQIKRESSAFEIWWQGNRVRPVDRVPIRACTTWDVYTFHLQHYKIFKGFVFDQSFYI
jgi:hypothetical protein